MKKKFLIVLTVIFFLFNPINILAEDFKISSNNVIMYNLNDNEIIYQKNINEKIYIASLTKIMTTIVAIENIKNLNDKVTITKKVFESIPTTASLAGFKVNDKVTYLDLLYGAMLPSGADATIALAQNISGSEKEFIDLMNKKAFDLGLKNTNFVNTSGLDVSNHYSTVYDMSMILLYALQNKTFKKIYEAKEYVTTNNIKMRSSLKAISDKYKINTNYIIGSKTGSTKKAGLCLSSTATNNNINFLLITANAPYASIKKIENISDAKTIYEYYFNNYSYQNIISKNDLITTINTKYTTINNLNIYAKETVKKYLPNNVIKDLKYNYQGLYEIDYKTKKNAKLGMYTITYNNKVLYTTDIILNQVLIFSLSKFLKNNPNIFITVVLIIITLTILTIKILKRKKKKRF